jgi:hypothetical protein
MSCRRNGLLERLFHVPRYAGTINTLVYSWASWADPPSQWTPVKTEYRIPSDKRLDLSSPIMAFIEVMGRSSVDLIIAWIFLRAGKENVEQVDEYQHELVFLSPSQE